MNGSKLAGVMAMMVFCLAGLIPAFAEDQGRTDSMIKERRHTIMGYRKVADLATQKLKAKDADGFIAMMDPEVVKKAGASKFKDMVNRVFIPFFSDYQRDGERLLVYRIHGKNGEEAYSFYPEVITSKGSEKNYAMTITENKMVASLVPNMTFKKDHPNFAAESKREQQQQR